MSLADPTPTHAHPGRPASPRNRRNRLNPLEALERGFALFQATFALEAWRYYLGAGPLVLCFIPMWVLNGQIRVSNGTLVMESALLAGAYLLRLKMIMSYMQRVRERAFGVPRTRVVGVLAQSAALGRLLAWKIGLTMATLLMVPSAAGAPWFYTACQFAGLDAGETTSEPQSLRRCLGLAGQWYGGSFLLFLMLVPVWSAVWLNSFAVAIILPQLLHSIFGLNTLLSTETGAYALLRSSAFWLSLFAGAWLALDPIVKCAFVVIYQHLRSQREGDDLRGLLASLPRQQEKKAEMMESAGGGRAIVVSFVLAAAILGCGSPVVAAAAAAQMSPTRISVEATDDSRRQTRIQDLRHALDQESQRAIYRWHDTEHPSPPTWLDELLAKVGRAIGRARQAIWKFLRKLWPRGLRFSTGKANGGWQMKDLRLWLVVVGIFCGAVGLLLIWLRRRREAAQASAPVEISPLPDLSNAVIANDRSEDEWFTMAERLEREGDLRLALRAAYLGLLAGMAQRQWLTIRRDRTNREYLDEFTRRWRRRPQAAVEARPEIPDKLRSSLRVFDRVWYGSHPLTPGAVAAYRQGQQELLTRV